MTLLGFQRQGERERAAFEAVAQPLIPEIRRHAVHLMGNPAEGEDLAQDVFLTAWRSFAKFQQGTNFRAWVFQILVNRSHHFRKKYFRLRQLKEEEESMMDQLRAPEPLPEALKDTDILDAIRALPDAHREVVLLADVQEFSYREIAAMLDVPIGTVMSRLNRARTTLRHKLAATAAAYGIKEKNKEGAA